MDLDGGPGSGSDLVSAVVGGHAESSARTLHLLNEVSGDEGGG